MALLLKNEERIDVKKEIDFVLSIANKLRGPYKASDYKKVIIPMIILRRFECALEKTKDKVLKAIEDGLNIPDYLCKESGYQFYNTSKFNLKNLLNDSDNLKDNLKAYIDGFSDNVKVIFNGEKEDKAKDKDGHEGLDFNKEIDKMAKSNRLYSVVKVFSELNLDPETVDNMKMGYMFEDIIRRYSTNAEAGDHYTPREVIKLLVNILLSEGSEDLHQEGKVTTVLDMACGTGGMLSTAYQFLKQINPKMDIKLFGQEVNGESYAICLSDMMIKGQDAKNIQFADTMKKDAFPSQSMRMVIANPPFGQAWGGKDAGEGVEKAVKAEHAKKPNGRFPAGLPGTGDMQLLFIQHAMAKLDKNGRAAILENGSPLFSGGTSSGESQIRRWLLDNDYLEAIIGLPNQLFYNTDIGIYAFIFSKNKRPERKNKIQFINAVDFWQPLRKSLGKKRKEISDQDIEKITELYINFKPNEYSKIFDREKFLYKEYAVYQPLQRNFIINDERIEQLNNSAFFDRLYNEDKYQELLETNPREPKQDKQIKDYENGKKVREEILDILNKNKSDVLYKNYNKFKIVLKDLFKNAFKDKTSAQKKTLIENTAFGLSVMDKTADIVYKSDGTPEIDKETKDTELIKVNDNVEKYFEKEVYPHVPDAMYFFEEDLTKKDKPVIKTGAEFPFTRYFYEYQPPEKSEVLLKKFFDIENSLNETLKELQNV